MWLFPPEGVTYSRIGSFFRASLFFTLWDKKTAPLDCKKHAKHVFIHSIRRFFHLLRPLPILLPIALLSFTHCSSSSGGGGGGGGSPVYTCANGAPSDGSPEGPDDVEQCASCNDGYSLVDEVLCRPPFYLHSNGITVRCPNAEVGGMGMVNGTEYTKRTVDQIKADNSLAATSCTSGISDMDKLFNNAATFNQDIGHWDVSSVTTMFQMFNVALAFDQDIGSWDVSNVMSMNRMFQAADSFDQDIGSWDVSSVTDMDGMFFQAMVFNQDLSGWCVSSIGSPPSDFATRTPSEFKDDATRQPQWGDPCSP